MGVFGKKKNQLENVSEGPQHGKQQRLIGGDRRAQHCQQHDVTPQSVRAGPYECDESFGWKLGFGFGVGVDEFFEGAEQEGVLSGDLF